MTEEDAFRLATEWGSCLSAGSLCFDGVPLPELVQIATFEHFFEGSNTQAQHLGIKALLKRLHLDWQVRFLASAFDRSQEVGEVELLAIFDVNNRPMISALNRIANAATSSMSVCAVVVDRGIRRQVDPRLPCVSWAGSYSARDEMMARRASADARREFALASSLLRDFLLGRGGDDKVDSFLEFFRGSLLQLMREIRAAENLLSRYRPKVLFLASDTHRVSRTFTLLAPRHGATTVVMQHGAPVWRYGYLPLKADYLMVWGESARDWFLENGVPSDRLKVVGNPIYDSLNAIHLGEGRDFPRKLVVLTNPIDQEIIDRLVKHACIFARTWDGSVIIKPHPSERNLRRYEKLTEGSPATVTRASFDELMVNPGDLFVVANSTSGIDAVMRGGIVVNLTCEGMPNPVDYGQSGVGITSKIDNFIQAVSSALSISYAEYLTARSIFLEKLNYRNDGQATERVAGFLKELVA